MKLRSLYDRTLVKPREDGRAGMTDDRYDRPSSGYGCARHGLKPPHPYDGPRRGFKPPHPYDGASRYDGPTSGIPTLPQRRPRSN